jgi:hypothetical protein
MTPRPRSAPEIAPKARLERPVTEEIHADEGEEAAGEGAGDGRPRYVANTMETAEIDVLRDKRATIISGIPAILAEEMRGRGETPARTPAPPRDPAAPEPERPERTRRVGDSGQQSAEHGSGPLGDASVAARRQRAAARIDEARAALDAGELAEAVTAAESALREADEAPPPGIIEVIEPARPLLTRVFASYVGPLGGVPVLAPRAHEIARARLGDAERAVMARIDGVRSLEELFDGSGLGSTDALRIAARLLRTGAIRIV